MTAAFVAAHLARRILGTAPGHSEINHNHKASYTTHDPATGIPLARSRCAAAVTFDLTVRSASDPALQALALTDWSGDFGA